MKIVIIILSVVYISSSNARCSSGNFHVFPKNNIRNNSCLLVEGYGNTLDFVELLTKEFPAFLVSEKNHRVKLNLLQFNQGAFRVNQVLLQPEKNLMKDQSYTLVVENLDNVDSEKNSISIPYKLTQDENPIKWSVKSRNNQPTALLYPPKFIDMSSRSLGCGPSVHAKFEFITDSNLPVLVKTELMDITDGTSTTYILKSDNDGTISIGHGMCSGGFKFKIDHLYQTRFSIMDNCNSYHDEWTNWIEFSSPSLSKN